MTQIILPKGLSGSGKSTWAKKFVQDNPSYTRVCRDELRFMLGFNWKMKKAEEKYVKELRNQIIRDLIVNGRDVIVDELNLTDKTEKYLRQEYPTANIVYWDFTDVHPNVCIERDAKREHSVGKKVILRQWRQFIGPNLPKLENTENLPVCCIFDLDGTLADVGDRNPYSRDFYNDMVVSPVGKMFHNMLHAVDKIFIFSGRSAEFETDTRRWLVEKLAVYGLDNRVILKMRKHDDKRSDDIIKQEFLNEILQEYHPVFAVDDRKQVKRMWNRNGIFVFDVNQYDIDF